MSWFAVPNVEHGGMLLVVGITRLIPYERLSKHHSILFATGATKKKGFWTNTLLPGNV
jgi:hypothetical protein